MNFFKKVASVVVSLPMIFSQASAYDYFMHLVKEDVKCERCGSRGRERMFNWHKKNVFGSYSIDKSKTCYSLYCVPYYDNKALCPQCKAEDYSIQVMNLVKTLMPVYDTKKLEELKSDQHLKEQWPKHFDCGIKNLAEGNTHETACHICCREIDMTTQYFYLCEYCGSGVCGGCGLSMKNYQEYTGKLKGKSTNENTVQCPLCKWGMLHYQKGDSEKYIEYAIDKIISLGKTGFDKMASALSAKAFTNSIIDDAKKSNKNKIYV